jgi:pimeloyl-ACP methyl ester carboxylesterase
MLTVVEDRTTQLPDGRTLGYTDTLTGRYPCFYFHGNPSSRVQARCMQRCAEHHDIRLIGPERPGYGLSTYQSGRSFIDWAADIAFLADALEIERFAVMGLSGGCAYTWACASQLADRVTVAQPVSGHVPPHLPHALDGVNREERVTLQLARNPLIAAAMLPLFWFRARKVRRDPAPPAPDQSSTGDCYDDRFRALTVYEARRQGGRAQWRELWIYARPWGFRPEDVTVPVHLWHGTDDIAASAAGARELAERVPACTFHLVPDVGHDLIRYKIHEIFDLIVASFDG